MKPFNTAKVRLYYNLNDFLPAEKRRKLLTVNFIGNPVIKDIIESLNIPHTEVDLILSNGNPVNFEYKLKDSDYISVYPEFKSLDLPEEFHLIKKYKGGHKFICDSHLGKLARYLRLFGFDTLYNRNINTDNIIRLANEESRTVLTRSILLLKNSNILSGYWIRSENPLEQLIQVLSQLELMKEINPLKRCIVCNGVLEKVDKEKIENELLPEIKKHFNVFYTCNSCKKIYWQGSHYERITEFIQKIKNSV